MTQTEMQELLTGEMQGAWTLDPEATTVRFSQKAMWGLASVNGTFAATEGSGRIDPSGVTGASFVLPWRRPDSRKMVEKCALSALIRLLRRTLRVRRFLLPSVLVCAIDGGPESGGRPRPVT